jgi:hypothetical protein
MRAAWQDKLWHMSDLALLDGIVIYLFSILAYARAAPVLHTKFEDHIEPDSAAEILRPRCGHWVQNEVSFSLTDRNKMIYAPYASLTVSPPFVNGSGWIKISWSGLPHHVDPLAFWIGVYLEDENVTTTAPIKYSIDHYVHHCKHMNQF